MLNVTTTVILGIRLLGRGTAATPALVAMDPHTLYETVLVRDAAPDFVCSGTFGAVDATRGLYYTLLQPKGTVGIHLGRFQLAPPAKMLATLPLPRTIAYGHVAADGAVVGVDEDGGAPYFARIDSASGNATCFAATSANFTMAVGGIVALDRATDRAYVVLGEAHGGNTFTLFTYRTANCELLAQRVLSPTPDDEGPTGLTFYRAPHADPAVDRGVLLAFMPPLDGGWQLVAIDPRSGSVTTTKALRGLGSLHVFDGSSVFVAPRPSSAALPGDVLHVAMSSAPGASSRIYGIDISCALAPLTTAPNCTLSSRAWPPPPRVTALADLGVYTPPRRRRQRQRQRQRQQRRPRRGALDLLHTVSGVSSGGGAAANHLVAFSSRVVGAGIIAGNPYGCGAAGGRQLSPANACAYNKPPIDLELLHRYTTRRAAEGTIDALTHLRETPLYMYSGTDDTVVWQAEMKVTASFFAQYATPSLMKNEWSIPSEHGYITDSCCQPCDESPFAPNDGFILNCGYDQPGVMLAHFYGAALLNRSATAPVANIYNASQLAYLPAGKTLRAAQMYAHAHVYVPTACAALPRTELTTRCRVHVNYHGCGGGGLSVPITAGYKEHAEANDLIVVFPQASAGIGNPNGCWDWTGLTGEAFDTRSGVQIGTVVRMINDLANAIVWSE